MLRHILTLLFIAASGLTAPAAAASNQTEPLSRGPHRIEIVLERYGNGNWTPVDSRLVLDQNDLIRFRIRSNFSGYLYVTNQSTSGSYDLLFPTADAGSNNRIEADREYVVPAGAGSFRITGPAGQEIVYWLIAPQPIGLTAPAAPPDAAPARAPTLIPRCDETFLRARGDCIDTSAGPRAVPDGAQLPRELSQAPNATSRELLFMQQNNSSVVASPGPLTAPAIYEFRISHR